MWSVRLVVLLPFYLFSPSLIVSSHVDNSVGGTDETSPNEHGYLQIKPRTSTFFLFYQPMTVRQRYEILAFFYFQAYNENISLSIDFVSGDTSPLIWILKRKKTEDLLGVFLLYSLHRQWRSRLMMILLKWFMMIILEQKWSS